MTSTIYLTKYPLRDALALNPENKPRKGWDANDPQFRHRAVMGIFGQFDESSPREHAGILFRLEFLPGNEPFFLIQSLVKPEFASTNTVIKEINVPEFLQGSTVRFRIAINAIRRTKSPDGRTPTVPVPFDSEYAEFPHLSTMTSWLQEKLSPALSEVSILNHQREVIGVSRNGERVSQRTVQIDTVDGFAVVADPQALQNMITSGIGRAKSYGCGLLSVAEV